MRKGCLTSPAAKPTFFFATPQVFRSPSHARPPEGWRLRQHFTRHKVEPLGVPRNARSLEGYCWESHLRRRCEGMRTRRQDEAIVHALIGEGPRVKIL